MTRSRTPRRAPRLVVKVVGFSFAVTAGVLAAVFVVLTWQTRERLTRAVTDGLEESQRRLADLQSRRLREHVLQAVALAEHPTLKAALDTYNEERSTGTPSDALFPTIERELAKLQQVLDVESLSVLDVQGVIVASAGLMRSDWAPGSRLRTRIELREEPTEGLVRRNGRAYLATEVPMWLGNDVIGAFVLAEPLDDHYAEQLAADTSTGIVIVLDGKVIASSMPLAVRRAVASAALPSSGTTMVGDETFVVRRLSAIGPGGVYALESLSDAVGAGTSEAGWVLALSGVGSLLLAAVGSVWMARALARPVGELTASLARMAAARDLTGALPRSGVSRELDALVDTFDTLRAALAKAEAESEDTYMGVIGTLANALDARDPYTAGHSVRVANLSVAIARGMSLPEREVEALRLGALLHDIGKIGVSDTVLRKPGRLTDEEYTQIKLHPTLGARILKPLRILGEHITIVELHHERPDGRGYPHGLRGDAIPILARIVHVADAFDAMTSARAYRSGRPVEAAIDELTRHRGTDFDPTAVDAIAALPTSTLSALSLEVPTGTRSLDGPGAIVPFRVRLSTRDRDASADEEGDTRALAS